MGSPAPLQVNNKGGVWEQLFGTDATRWDIFVKSSVTGFNRSIQHEPVRTAVKEFDKIWADNMHSAPDRTNLESEVGLLPLLIFPEGNGARLAAATKLLLLISCSKSFTAAQWTQLCTQAQIAINGASDDVLPSTLLNATPSLANMTLVLGQVIDGMVAAEVKDKVAEKDRKTAPIFAGLEKRFQAGEAMTRGSFFPSLDEYAESAGRAFGERFWVSLMFYVLELDADACMYHQDCCDAARKACAAAALYRDLILATSYGFTLPNAVYLQSNRKEAKEPAVWAADKTYAVATAHAEVAAKIQDEIKWLVGNKKELPPTTRSETWYSTPDAVILGLTNFVIGFSVFLVSTPKYGFNPQWIDDNILKA